MEINTIDFFGKSVNMIVLDDVAVGEIESNKFLIESSNGFLDIMDAKECKEVYGVNPTEFIK